MSDTTATFRDYAFEDLSGGTFSIDTATDVAVFRMADNHPEFAFEIRFDRETARRIGTDLMQWVGSPLCHAYDDYGPGIGGGGFEINVADGEAEITAAKDGEISHYTPTWEQAVDIAQRLIVFGGVAAAVTTDA